MCLYPTKSTRVIKEDMTVYKMMELHTHRTTLELELINNFSEIETHIISPFREKKYKFRRVYKDDKTELIKGKKQQEINRAYHVYSSLLTAIYLAGPRASSSWNTLNQPYVIVRCTIPKDSLIAEDEIHDEIACNRIRLDEIIYASFDVKSEPDSTIIPFKEDSEFYILSTWKNHLKKYLQENGYSTHNNYVK